MQDMQHLMLFLIVSSSSPFISTNLIEREGEEVGESEMCEYMESLERVEEKRD